MRLLKRMSDAIIDRASYICESIMEYIVYVWDMLVDFVYEYKWSFAIATIVLGIVVITL